MQVAISGTLNHRMGSQARRFDYSNGVRGWIVSSRRGVLASWVVRGYEAETSITALDVEGGEHLDFAVDSLGDYESDAFRWAPQVKEVPQAGQDGTPVAPRTWRPEDEFARPEEDALGALEQYAQVLLMTNELAFKD